MRARRGTVLRLLPPVSGDAELAEALAIVRRLYARRRTELGEEYWGHLLFMLPVLEECGALPDDDPDPDVEVPERTTAERAEAAR